MKKAVWQMPHHLYHLSSAALALTRKGPDTFLGFNEAVEDLAHNIIMCAASLHYVMTMAP